jgi:hypothetical protein
MSIGTVDMVQLVEDLELGEGVWDKLAGSQDQNSIGRQRATQRLENLLLRVPFEVHE